MKRTLSLVLAVIMCICMIPAVSAASTMTFTDVPTTEWYYNDVKNAYESGLINGKSAEFFKPEDHLLYCEAVKLAACMNQLYYDGAVSLVNGDPWYATFVEYCLDEGIISKLYEWEEKATRAGYMEIFASALPDEALPVINNVPAGSIPDVPVHHPQAAAIYKLYRAGILQGNDAVTHICKPDDNIKRSEVAAILSRMMDPTKRVKFSMGDPMEIAVQPKDAEDIEKNGSAVFTVKAKGGAAPYSYRWQMKSAAGADWKDLNDASTGIYKNNGGETD
ncbi:MAG: S-layer homology domain-containing protein, partial [Clostridia bacterium]|nr:S-layer homology domain-containing protein [Clostridia bacterium]